MNRNYILTALGICLLALLSIFSIYLYYSLNLYSHYLVTISIVLGLVIILTTSLYFSKNITKYNIGTFIMFLCNVILIYNIYDINKKDDYVTNLITHEYNYETYNIYVQRKNTTYSNLNKLENKNIGILTNNEENLKTYINKNMNVNILIYNSIGDIGNAIENGQIQAFILTEEEYNKSDFDIKFKVKSIYQDKIKESKNI